MTTGYLVAASARISYGVVRPGSALGSKNRRNVNAFLRFSAAFSRLGWDFRVIDRRRRCEVLRRLRCWSRNLHRLTRHCENGGRSAFLHLKSYCWSLPIRKRTPSRNGMYSNLSR